MYIPGGVPTAVVIVMVVEARTGFWLSAAENPWGKFEKLSVTGALNPFMPVTVSLKETALPALTFCAGGLLKIKPGPVAGTITFQPSTLDG